MTLTFDVDYIHQNDQSDRNEGGNLHTALFSVVFPWRCLRVRFLMLCSLVLRGLRMSTFAINSCPRQDSGRIR